jgi:hypothetical protein
MTRARRDGARQAGAAALLLLALSACQASGAPQSMPPLRDRNYACDVYGPGDTYQDEVLCQYNKHTTDR